MEFKKKVVNSWSRIVREAQDGTGDLKIFLSKETNSILNSLNLNYEKKFQVKFSKESLFKYEKLILSINYFNFLKENYKIQNRNPNSISEITTNDLIESYNSIIEMDSIFDAETKLQSQGVYLGVPKLFSKLNQICPAEISGIIITKGENIDVYNLEVYYDENIIEQYSIKYNKVEENEIDEIIPWTEIFRHKTMPDFVFEVFKYLNEKDDLDVIQKFLIPNDNPKYYSLIYGDKKNGRIFWCFDYQPSIEDLMQGTKQRAFETKSFELNNYGYYLSKEWENKTGGTLDINIFIDIFNAVYSSYQIIKDGDFYVLRIHNQKLLIPRFYKATQKAGLIFSTQIIQRFVASLCTKPFLICSGLSGSGKTKLAQAFVQWITESENQYKIIPVGADWTNREPLLGYPNGLEPNSYVMPDSGALKLILNASNDQSKPYFMILDEMNLSHVERYFADFLSIMESGDKLKLYSGENRYSKYIKGTDPDEKDYIPQEIEWPKNLFIIGTVNIDETTYMFSPKVLDRANVIEFRITPNEMKNFFAQREELKMKRLFIDENKENGGLGKGMGVSFLEEAKKNAISKITAIEGENNVLNNFFSELQKVGAEFGYRSATEIELLITKLGNQGFVNEESIPLDDNIKIDIAIMQKLLPKLHGSRKKLITPLEILAGFCIKRKEGSKPDSQNEKKNLYQQYIAENKESSNWVIMYPISLDKIERMYKNVIDNGFTSYAEA